VLGHEQDAEDAFQATFIVLARNAGSVQRAGAVGSWLYGVACNVARKARASRLRRNVKEQEAAAQRSPAAPQRDPDDWREVLDAELVALPEKYRAPVVLCDLMGLTAEAAAREVGCPPKTLETRLRRGRGRLAVRLARRGVALPAGALALELSRCTAEAAAPVRLVAPAIQAALGFLSGSAGAVSPAVVALIEEGTNLMMLKSTKCVALLACVVLAGGGLSYHAAAPGKADSAPGVRASGAAPAARSKAPPPDFLEHLHRALVMHLHAVLDFAHGRAEAADKKEEKVKEKKKVSLSGVWVLKDADLKLDFSKKDVLKIYPHGDKEAIVLSCEYSVGKDGRVKAKVTGLEGNKEAKEKIEEHVPVGTAFSFRWKVKGAAATLSDLKGDKEDDLKSHLEGDYTEKK
jgi:RNA polymerase sigma factor (sigma-70 family)